MPCDSQCAKALIGDPAHHSSSDVWQTAVTLMVALLALGGPAVAQGASTPPEPSAPQSTLADTRPADIKPGPPIVQSIVGPSPPSTLEVRKAPARHVAARREHAARHHARPVEIDRPALAGVQLLRPLPPPGQPPHFVVPTPAYPFENFVTAYTTPPPPLFCHPTRLDPNLPDPRLYRERAVTCEPDNP